MALFEWACAHIGVLSVGLMRAALADSIAYAREAKQLDKTIAGHQMIAEKIADMATLTDAARLLCCRAFGMIDAGVDCDVEMSMAQWFGGYPTYLKFEGTGTLSQFSVLGTAKSLSPTVLVRYHFFDAQTKFRPYVGLGVNYTKFTDAQITNTDFVAGKMGPGESATVSAASSWAPAFAAGANHALDDHWSVGLSVSYVPLKTSATLTGTTAGGTVIVSHASIKLRPITTFLNVGYRF